MTIISRQRPTIISPPHCISKKSVGLSFMDVLTGEFRVIEFKSASELTEELHRIGASELIVCEGSEYPPKGENGSSCSGELPVKKISYVGKYDFSLDVALKRLTKKFNVQSMDGFGCKDFSSGLQAAGALLHYVSDSQRSELTHIERLSPYNLGNYLTLDHTSRRNLEIIENIRDGGVSNTLLDLLDKTMTSLGARKLRFGSPIP